MGLLHGIMRQAFFFWDSEHDSGSPDVPEWDSEHNSGSPDVSEWSSEQNSRNPDVPEEEI